jgi:hypothetical protein
MSRGLQAHPPDSLATMLVHDLRQDWQVYQPQYKAYVAYSAYPRSSAPISFWLHSLQAPYQLYIAYQGEYALFINKKLVMLLPEEQASLQLSIDSLQKTLQVAYPFFCTLYPKSTKAQILHSLVLSPQASARKTEAEVAADAKKKLLEERRKPGTHRDFLIIALGLLLSLYTLLGNGYPKILAYFYNFYKMLFLSRLEESLFVNKSFGAANILFLGAYGVLVGLALWSSNQILDNGFLPQELIRLGYLRYALPWQLLVLAGVSLGLLLAKYLLISITAALLGLQRLVVLHFYEYTRISQFFYTIFLLVAALLLLLKPYQAGQGAWFFQYGLPGFYTFRLLLLWRQVNKVIEFRNLYLFSYLCITEIIPFLFLLKLFVF